MKCGKSFRDPSTRTRHEKIHYKHLHKCGICNVTFVKKQNLQAHIAKEHSAANAGAPVLDPSMLNVSVRANHNHAII